MELALLCSLRLSTAARAADLLGPCPILQKLAAAAEQQYPGYGERLVYVAYGSGLRISELLALRVEHVDLETGLVQVEGQLDRYGKWPAVKPPKGGRSRVALLWACYLDVAATLVEDARAREGEEHGWLFPRHRSRTKWADQAGKLMAAAAAEACDWDWSFHWLRHAWASTSLAPLSSGGYGLPLVSVSRWLGHRSPSPTQDHYVQPAPDGTVVARMVTATKSGQS